MNKKNCWKKDMPRLNQNNTFASVTISSKSIFLLLISGNGSIQHGLVYRMWPPDKCITLVVYMTDGERPKWGSSGQICHSYRPEAPSLIISALRCWNSGCVGWAELPGSSLAPFQSKDHNQPLSIRGENWRGMRVLRHPIRAKTAAFSSFLSPS